MTVSGPPAERIAAIARLQRGRITRAQLRDLGFASSTITRMAARGELFREHLGVFAVGHLAEMPLAREAAALLACARGTVLGYRSAAALCEMGPAPAVVELILAGRRTAQPHGVTVHRTTHLDSREVTVRDRLPLTTPARTLLDLADVLDRRALERALDGALTANLTTLHELHAMLERHPGRRGAPELRRLLDPARPTTRTRSGKEEVFLALVRAAGLPAPQVNARFDRYEIDFLWPEQRFAVEIDSHRWHGGREAYGRDRRKGLLLAQAGIDLLRLTWEQVEDDVPAVTGTIAFRLGRAAA